MECLAECLERYAPRPEGEKDPAQKLFETVLFYVFQTMFWGIFS